MTRDGLHELVGGLLRRHEQRYTDGRRALIDALADAARPMSIPELMAAVTNIPQSSAYRHLSVLADVGAVDRIAGGDDFGRFEIAEALTGHHHHHLVCTRCASVLDVELSPAFERAFAAAATDVLQRVGFAVNGHEVVFNGMCADCQAAASATDAAR